MTLSLSLSQTHTHTHTHNTITMPLFSHTHTDTIQQNYASHTQRHYTKSMYHKHTHTHTHSTVHYFLCQKIIPHVNTYGKPVCIIQGLHVNLTFMFTLWGRRL